MISSVASADFPSDSNESDFALSPSAKSSPSADRSSLNTGLGSNAGMGEVLGDLAEIGYDAEWHCIPASCVGLPHVRDRLWIVANDHCQRGEGLGPFALPGLYSVPWRENERRATNWRERPDLHGPFLCGSGNGVSPRLDAIGNAVTPLIPEIIGRAIIKYTENA